MRIAITKLILQTTALVSVMIPVAALAQQRAFDLPPQSATKSVPEFARQAGIQIVAPGKKLRGVNTSELKGTYDVRAALKKLIAGAGLQIVKDDGTTITLAQASAAPVTRSQAYQATALGSGNMLREQAGPAPAREEVAADDIIVTARRRDETSIAVPVVLTAETGAELTRRGINSLDSVAQLVPGLTLLDSGGSRQGGTISMRGVAGPDTNPLGDQAVSFNVDGVQVAKSSVRRLAVMDLQQVEVLKGPQALFFGKNSPGGIISMRTADPTSHFEAKASLGYEVNAHEWRGDGFISGPLTDTLGARLAFYGADMRGWVKNIVPADSILPPIDR